MKQVTRPRLFGAFTDEVRTIIEGAVKSEGPAAAVVLNLEKWYMIENRPWEHVRVLSFSRLQKTLCGILEAVAPEKTEWDPAQ